MKLNKKPKEPEKIKIPVGVIFLVGILVILIGSCFLSSFLSGFQGQTMEQMKPITPTPTPTSTNFNPATDGLMAYISNLVPFFIAITILLTALPMLQRTMRRW